MISPAVGRQVWFYPRDHGAVTSQPWAATICYVHTDRKVNLQVIDPNGNPHPQSAIRLLQDSDVAEPETPYCEWPPTVREQERRNLAMTARFSTLANLPVLDGSKLITTLDAPKESP